MAYVLDNPAGQRRKTAASALAERMAPVAAVSAVVFLVAVLILL
ncbi:hypothetical protein [Ciceribacter selenitireducens]